MYKESPIRHKEIKAIKELMALDLSQSEIARRLNLCRTSVCRTINKIKAGKELRFDNKPTMIETYGNFQIKK